MNPRILLRAFGRIGARLRFRNPEPMQSLDSGLVRLDVVLDEGGEAFEIQHPRRNPPELLVLDVRPADRHLLLLVRSAQAKSKFLCGYDERHWFAAAIVESAPVGTVLQALEALKPGEVQARQAGLKARHRSRRKNIAFVRQGEWFFVPADIGEPDPMRVLRNEPLRRGGGRPHVADQCYRVGGGTAYVCDRYPAGVDGIEYGRIRKWERETKPPDRSTGWHTERRQGLVYVRGKVKHPDHATLVLNGWHRALPNTEHDARAVGQVAILD